MGWPASGKLRIMLRIGRLGLGAEIGLIGTHERFRLATLGDTMGMNALAAV